MKTLILYFMCAAPAFAGTCEQRVEKIRQTPAKLISDSDYGLMLKGCPKAENPPEFISDPNHTMESDTAKIARLEAENAYLGKAYAAMADALGNRATKH